MQSMVLIMQKKLIGNHLDKDVYAYTLTNSRGMTADVTNFGATLLKLITPDRLGEFTDVVLGYDALAAYETAGGYQGATVGRYANRIARGAFSLNGVQYSLYKNDNGNSLHGGRVGFSHRVWDVTALTEREITLDYVSPNGEEGYPGTLCVTVTYSLTDDNALYIRYEAKSDSDTPLNLTNHSYFNLQGHKNGDILSHTLWLDADAYLPTDDLLIPTGEICSVSGTPFDFRIAHAIGRDMESGALSGYDHCLRFTPREGGVIHRATLSDKVSGRVMRVFTDRPCVQLYTGNFLTPKDPNFKGNVPQAPHMGVCLETQLMPDSINQPAFTDCVLRAGDTFKSTTALAFGK